MLTEPIEINLPLTYQDNATIVFVVSSQENLPLGVYFSLERAQQYIDDWMNDIEKLEGFDRYKPVRCEEEDLWRYRGYEIRQDILRK